MTRMIFRRYRALVFAALFLVVGLGAVWSQEASDEISCPHHENKVISFSSEGAHDILSIDLLGVDCTKSIVTIVIRTESGAPIFWDAWPLWNLSSIRLSEEGQVARVFGGLQAMEALNSAQAPEYGSECFVDEFCYLGRSVNEEKYAAIRAKKLPLLCTPVHYENTHCYYYDTKSHRSQILYGYGV
jgi:hypothetical protein